MFHKKSHVRSLVHLARGCFARKKGRKISRVGSQLDRSKKSLRKIYSKRQVKRKRLVELSWDDVRR